jgi:hypothetical protein
MRSRERERGTAGGYPKPLCGTAQAKRARLEWVSSGRIRILDALRRLRRNRRISAGFIVEAASPVLGNQCCWTGPSISTSKLQRPARPVYY